MEERHNLGARTAGFAAEGIRTRTRGDPVFKGPKNRLAVVGSVRNVLEGTLRCFRLRAADHSPKERDDLRVRCGPAGGEGRLRSTGGNALGDCPIDRVIVVAALRNVHKSDNDRGYGQLDLLCDVIVFGVLRRKARQEGILAFRFDPLGRVCPGPSGGISNDAAVLRRAVGKPLSLRDLYDSIRRILLPPESGLGLYKGQAETL